MEQITMTFDGRGISVHVLLSISASYSSNIAGFQFGSRSAQRGILGIRDRLVSLKLWWYLGFVLKIPYWLLMMMLEASMCERGWGDQWI